MAKSQCEDCIYWKYIGGDRACHYLLETEKRRVRDGEKCLSYAADNRKCRKDVS